MNFETTISWVLYSIRQIMGLTSLRNEIVETLLPNSPIECGPTFGSDSTPAELQAFLHERLTRPHNHQKPWLLFTAINRPQSGETHYQGFLVDIRHQKMYIADPAYTRQGPGIYKPFIAQQQVIPWMEQHHITSEFIPTTHPCQTSEDDVFCQSWTLYLLIEFVRNSFQTVSIPPSQKRRYSILLQFYKKLAHTIPSFCPLLQEYYVSNVSRHRSLVREITCPKERKQIRTYYKTIDPCHVLLHQMKTKDMSENDNEDSSR